MHARDAMYTQVDHDHSDDHSESELRHDDDEKDNYGIEEEVIADVVDANVIVAAAEESSSVSDDNNVNSTHDGDGDGDGDGTRSTNRRLSPALRRKFKTLPLTTGSPHKRAYDNRENVGTALCYVNVIFCFLFRSFIYMHVVLTFYKRVRTHFVLTASLDHAAARSDWRRRAVSRVYDGAAGQSRPPRTCTSGCAHAHACNQ
jgi:hypothetical protein